MSSHSIPTGQQVEEWVESIAVSNPSRKKCNKVITRAAYAGRPNPGFFKSKIADRHTVHFLQDPGRRLPKINRLQIRPRKDPVKFKVYAPGELPFLLRRVAKPSSLPYIVIHPDKTFPKKSLDPDLDYEAQNDAFRNLIH